MSSVPVRRATAQDASACAAIVDAWINDTPWMPRGIERSELEELLREGLPKREAYVIDKPVAGYLSLEPLTDHIWGLYVGRTGEGLGKTLLDAAKQGRNYLRLNSHKANEQAHRFYQREGFEKTGAEWLGDDGIEEITMEWSR